MGKLPRTIYYKSYDQEFSRAEISPRRIDGKYVYRANNFFWKMSRFFWYRIVAFPLAFLYLKAKFKFSAKNKKVLKQIGEKGFFLYANHTQETGDAFIPTFAAFPKDVFVIVHANNVSMPVLKYVTPRLGALPLPDNLAAAKNFATCIKRLINKGKVITVYPEAHIWPYYTGIRPFGPAAFGYPAKLNAPSYCLTNTYSKSKFSDKAVLTAYLDGPFFPDLSLGLKEREEDLKNRIYEKMTERSKLSDYQYIKYIKEE